MFNFWSVVYLLFIGIVAGFVARLLVPGRNRLGFWGTVLLGIVGSIVGGLVGYALFDNDGGGFLLALAATIVLLLVLRRTRTVT